MSLEDRPLVLVTGATGFIGSAITLLLIERGYRVRATARSFPKVNSFLSRHPSVAGSLAWSIVPDMTASQAYDSAVTGVDYVIHTAAPVNRTWREFDQAWIDLSVKGVLNVLEAAAREPQVKRVVMTSSFAACVNQPMNPRPGYTYTDRDWSSLNMEDAKNGGDPAYVVSKKMAEQAAWQFITNRNPSFTLTTFCPPLVYGPPLQPIDSMTRLNTSADEVWKLMNGSCETVPPTLIPTWIDVRDVARMHVAALSHPRSGNQRYITVAGTCSNSQIAHILAQSYPELAADGKIPPSDNSPPPPMHAADSSKAVADFGGNWIGFEKSVRDTAEMLLQLHKRLGR